MFTTPDGTPLWVFHTGNEDLIFWVLVLALIASVVAGSWDYFVKAAAQEKERKARAKALYQDDDPPPPTMGFL